MKKLLELFLLVFMCTGTAFAQAESEPNETWDLANAISLNSTGTGTLTISPSWDRDWWKVSIPGDGKLNVSWTSLAGVNVYCEIYDTLGVIGLNTGSYTTSTQSISTDGLAKGTYYLHFRTYYSNETGGYNFTPTFTAASVANDVEPNNTSASGGAMSLNGTVTGHINYYYNNQKDAFDWYKINVTAEGKLDWTITSGNSQNVYAELFDGDAATILAGSYTVGSASFSKDGLAAGTYYMRVRTYYSNEYVPYTITTSYTVPLQANDVGSNDVYTGAATLAINGGVTGHIGYRYNGNIDVYDWFKVTTNADGRLDWTIISANAQNVYAELFDGDGSTYLAGGYTTGTSTFSKDGLKAGIYYMRVRTYYSNEFAPYTLSNALVTTGVGNDAEPNDDRASAKSFAVNTTTTGHIGYSYNGTRDVVDFYSIVLPSDGKLAWTVTSGNTQNIFAELFDNDGTTYLAGSYTPTSASFSLDGLAAGTYYMRVRTYYTNEFSPYTLSNTFTPTSFAAENPASNKFAAIGTVLPANTATTGHVNYYYNLQRDTLDWWQIGYDGNGTMNLLIEQELHNDNGYHNLTYNLYADTTASPILTGYFASPTQTFPFSGLAVGKYYLRIGTYFNNEFASYRLTANYTERCTNAVSIGSSSQLAGCLGTITYNITGGLAPYSVQLYKDGSPSGAIQTTNGTITFNSLDTGTYYARSYSFGYSGSCNNVSSNTVFAAPATPTITGTLSFCAGGNTVLTSSAGTSYIWSNGATTQSITVSAAGTYNVRVTNAAACTSAVSQNAVVSVNPLPTVTLNTFNSVCNTDAVFALSGGSPAGGFYSGTNVTGGQFNPQTAGVGTFPIIYSYTNANGCSNTAIQSITVTNCSTCSASISAGGPTTFCQGGSVTLTANAGASYLWSNGATSQSITVNTQGSYTVTVTNANNCSATSAATVVTVNTLPSTPTISGNLSFCAGATTTLTSSAATSYLWSNGATTQAITVSAAGNFTVTVKNAAGCSATSASSPVTVKPLPTVTLGTFNSVCNTSAAFALSGGLPTGGTYSGTGVSSGQFNPATAGVGTFPITYSFTNANGCSNTATQNITVTNCSECIASISASGPITFCAGGSVTLTASAGVSYLWSNGATLQSITVSAQGNYSVTVTNANNCSATSGVTAVTVNPLPTVTLGTFNAVCNTAAAFALSGGSPTGGTYSGTGVSGGQFNPTTAGVGTFPITYSYTNANGCSKTATQNITVTNCSTCTASISAGGATTFCAGGSVTLTASAGGSYLWSNGATSQSITVSTQGSYTVTVTNANNCSATSTATVVTVNALPSTPTISAGGPTAFCTPGSVTLTSSAAASNLWSNGATTQSIAVTNGGSYTVKVTNAAGCSATSATTVVTANNCGGTYCTASGGSGVKGYISRVEACYGFNNVSGWNNGYGDFTRFSVSSSPGKVIGLAVTPGYPAGTCATNLYVRVWIDWNGDGDFADAKEVIYAPYNSTTTVKVKIWVTVPAGTMPGDKRMRVLVSPERINNPCGNFAYGEVEDYTVKINAAYARPSLMPYSFNLDFDEPANVFTVYPNPASSRVVVERSGFDENKTSADPAMIIVRDINGRVVLQQKMTSLVQAVDVSRLANGTYSVTIMTSTTKSTNRIIVSH